MLRTSMILTLAAFAGGCNKIPDACSGDLDGDGYDACFEGGVFVGPDCDDDDAAINPDPATIEIWYNGIDENCDGNDLDQDGDGENSDLYADADGVWGVDCNDLNDAIYTTAREDATNGIDDNCDSYNASQVGPHLEIRTNRGDYDGYDVVLLRPVGTNPDGKIITVDAKGDTTDVWLEDSGLLNGLGVYIADAGDAVAHFISAGSPFSGANYPLDSLGKSLMTEHCAFDGDGVTCVNLAEALDGVTGTQLWEDVFWGSSVEFRFDDPGTEAAGQWFGTSWAAWDLVGDSAKDIIVMDATGGMFFYDGVHAGRDGGVFADGGEDFKIPFGSSAYCFNGGNMAFTVNYMVLSCASGDVMFWALPVSGPSDLPVLTLSAQTRGGEASLEVLMGDILVGNSALNRVRRFDGASLSEKDALYPANTHSNSNWGQNLAVSKLADGTETALYIWDYWGYEGESVGYRFELDDADGDGDHFPASGEAFSYALSPGEDWRKCGYSGMHAISDFPISGTEAEVIIVGCHTDDFTPGQHFGAVVFDFQ